MTNGTGEMPVPLDYSLGLVPIDSECRRLEIESHCETDQRGGISILAA